MFRAFVCWSSLLALLAPFACSSGGPPADTLVVGLEGNPTALDPRFSIDAHSTRIGSLLFNGVTRIDASGHPIGDLAASIERRDNLHLTIRLRDGVRFHDGTPLTSADVAATWNAIRDPALGSPLRASFEPIASIKTPGPLELAVTLRKPYAPLLVSLAVGILPAAQAATAGALREPVGTGPYRLREWSGDEAVELAAVDDHFAGRPHIGKIRFRVLPEETTRILEMRKGGIDLLHNAVPPVKVRLFEENPHVRVLTKPGSTYAYLGLNLRDPLLANPRVRRALAHALDRRAIIRYRYRGHARIAEALLPASHWAGTDEIAPYAYDPASARALLDEAGFDDPDGDGPLPRFELTYSTSTDDDARALAEIVKAMWSRVGVRVEIRSHEWGTFFRDVRTGNYQVYSLRWVGVTEPDHLYYVYHSSMIPPAGANRVFYANPEVDRLLERARTMMSEDERAPLYRRIQRLLARDLPVISLWHFDNIALVSDRIQPIPLPVGTDLSPLTAARWQ